MQTRGRSVGSLRILHFGDKLGAAHANDAGRCLDRYCIGLQLGNDARQIVQRALEQAGAELEFALRRIVQVFVDQ
jgi:hypothetical protein